MDDVLERFIEGLATIEVTPNVYNQYDYSCKENEIRRKNLLVYLKEMYKLKPRILLLGEAPGYRGCRITGVPFTSEFLLMNTMEGLNFFGKAAGYMLPKNKEKLMKEATATIIWDAMIKFDILALSWNSFPFHPHKPDNPVSNRAPLKRELEIGEKPLLQLIEIYNIEYIVAIGRKAETTLKKLNMPHLYVRHPAQGGKNEFVEGMGRIKAIFLQLTGGVV